MLWQWMWRPCGCEERADSRDGPPTQGEPRVHGNICCDVIFSERRGQSQKPEEIYRMIERMVPGGTLSPGLGEKGREGRGA